MATGSETGPGPAHDSVQHLAHHFATPKQQYDSAKSGMWLFLSTEILLFSGLFCAYAVYRANHPEIFIYAHQYLDKTLGGVNTLVLILSSLTAAWAVRAAQMGQRRLLIGLLAATIFCGLCFLGIKGIEYEHKWKHGLLWGARFHPETVHAVAPDQPGVQAPGGSVLPGVSVTPGASVAPAAPVASAGSSASGASPPPVTSVAAGSAGRSAAPGDPLQIRTNIVSAARGPAGLAKPSTAAGAAAEEVGSRSARSGASSSEPGAPLGDRPQNVQVFFSIYFAMTGLHALHVIGGLVAFTFLLVRAARGQFGPDYYTPVDLTALYWHVVDLVWIYLFPLLYLIR
jgi:cytochrome c oxidase subunit 3